MRKAISAFTMIELLVVVGIIALLAGILLPALGKSMRTGKESVCLNNQRQIMIRVALYCHDSKGYLLPSGLKTGMGTYSNQQYAMFLSKGEYAGDGKHSVAICPEDDGLLMTGYEKFPAQNWSVISPWYLSADTDAAWSASHPATNQGVTGTGTCYFVSYQTNGHAIGKKAIMSPKIDKVANPASTYLFCDGYSDDVDMSATPGTFRSGSQGNGRVMQYVVTRHRGAAINCYLDGSSRKYLHAGGVYKDRCFVYSEFQNTKPYFDNTTTSCPNGCSGKINPQDPWGWNTGHSVNAEGYCGQFVNFAGNPGW